MKLQTDQIGAWINRLTPIIGIVLFSVAVMIVHHELEIYHWHEISGAITALPWPTLLGAAALTLLGYTTLTYYDWLALEYAGAKLPYRRVALTSFLSYSISNNVGHALLTGGSMRYRLYSSWGLQPTTIAKVIGFTAIR